jgi:hypothetical protein
MQDILPILDAPDFPFRSPEVVRILDRFRFKLDDDDRYSEFSWFAREYPRVYRHHLDHVKHRLLLIHESYKFKMRLRSMHFTCVTRIIGHSIPKLSYNTE